MDASIITSVSETATRRRLKTRKNPHNLIVDKDIIKSTTVHQQGSADRVGFHLSHDKEDEVIAKLARRNDTLLDKLQFTSRGVFTKSKTAAIFLLGLGFILQS